MQHLTQDRAREVWHYEPETGSFTWNRSGKIAGTIDKYVFIRFNGIKYYAHRLAWFYIHGEWPKYIDHINGDGTDNRLCNLRPATMSQNQANRKGIRGIEKHGRKYRARLMVDGIKIEIGSYETMEEATAAYFACADKHFGEFVGH